MPYSSQDELPENVQSALAPVPHALDIYQAAYNNAYDQYAKPSDRRDGYSREETAHAVAWSAVKQQYEQTDDGTWRRRDSSDRQ